MRFDKYGVELNDSELDFYDKELVQRLYADAKKVIEWSMKRLKN